LDVIPQCNREQDILNYEKPYTDHHSFSNSNQKPLASRIKLDDSNVSRHFMAVSDLRHTWRISTVCCSGYHGHRQSSNDEP
jgi:hypothetical protein